VLLNFDALDRGNGYSIQIEEVCAGGGCPRVRRDTATVDENQCGARVEATQGDRSCSRRTARAGRVILNWNAVRTRDRLTLEKLFRSGDLTRLVNHVAI